jgi:hypothetical protein
MSPISMGVRALIPRRLITMVQTGHCSVFQDQRSRCPIHPARAPDRVLRSRRVIFPSKAFFPSHVVSRKKNFDPSNELYFLFYFMQPLQMTSATQVDHRSHLSNHGISSYTQHPSYSSVKVEDDHYAVRPAFRSHALLFRACFLTLLLFRQTTPPIIPLFNTPIPIIIIITLIGRVGPILPKDNIFTDSRMPNCILFHFFHRQHKKSPRFLSFRIYPCFRRVI